MTPREHREQVEASLLGPRACQAKDSRGRQPVRPKTAAAASARRRSVPSAPASSGTLTASCTAKPSGG